MGTQLEFLPIFQCGTERRRVRQKTTKLCSAVNDSLYELSFRVQLGQKNFGRESNLNAFAFTLQGSSTSFAIKRKDELERVAKSNR